MTYTEDARRTSPRPTKATDPPRPVRPGSPPPHRPRTRSSPESQLRAMRARLATFDPGEAVMASINEMRASRQKLFDEMNNLLTGAERRGQELSEKQTTRWRELDAQVTDLGAQIEEKVLAERSDAVAASEFRESATYRDMDRTGRAGQLLRSAAVEAGFRETRGVLNSAVPGAAFSPPDHARYVLDFLAADSVALRSGLRVIRTERQELRIPHVTADPASAWTAEAATITPTDPTAETVSATPRKIAALTVLSNEVVEDSEPSVLDMVARGLLRSLALKFDLGVFEGSGTAPEIRGLANVAGIQTESMGTNGATPTNLDPFAAAISKLEVENSSASAIVMHPRTWGTLIKLKEQSSGNNKPLLQESAGSGSQGVQRRIYGTPVFLTSQLSTTETVGTSTDTSSAYVYAADQVVAVLRTDARFEVDRSRLFNSDQSEARAKLRADVVVPNPKAVCRITGIRAI